MACWRHKFRVLKKRQSFALFIPLGGFRKVDLKYKFSVRTTKLRISAATLWRLEFVTFLPWNLWKTFGFPSTVPLKSWMHLCRLRWTKDKSKLFLLSTVYANWALISASSFQASSTPSQNVLEVKWRCTSVNQLVVCQGHDVCKVEIPPHSMNSQSGFKEPWDNSVGLGLPWRPRVDHKDSFAAPLWLASAQTKWLVAVAAHD